MASGSIPVIAKVGPFGNKDWEKFAVDMDVTGVQRIVKIGIKHTNTSIDGLHVHYQRYNKVEATYFGGTYNGIGSEAILNQSEFITRISFSMNATNISGMTGLTIWTNERKFGPYGSPGEVVFEIPAQNNTTPTEEIIGFFGRSRGSMYVTALGVYVKASNKSRGGSAGGNASGGTSGGASGGNASGNHQQAYDGKYAYEGDSI